jgi:hypothetical protein
VGACVCRVLVLENAQRRRALLIARVEEGHVARNQRQNCSGICNGV